MLGARVFVNIFLLLAHYSALKISHNGKFAFYLISAFDPTPIFAGACINHDNSTAFSPWKSHVI